MRDDMTLAELLGQAPRGPDPGFRFDVFALIAARARRRAALRRAVRTVLLFAALGLVFPLAGAAGLTMETLRPFLLLAGLLACAALFARVSIEGPRGVLARSRALVQFA